MKKLLAVLLCLVMVLSLFAGCNQGTTPTTTAPKATNPPATSGNKPAGTTAPQTTAKEEPTKVVIALPISANVQDYDTNDFTLWIEETCNVEIEFMKLQTAAADYKAQLSTMFLDSSAILPDIYWGFNIDELYAQYGDDGYFLDLTPYYEDKEGASAIFWGRMDVLRAFDPVYAATIEKKLHVESGAIYAVPTVEVSLGDTIDTVACINQDWLTKLNLEMPTDCESLYKVLVAFRDGDPNGNGKKDEVPIMGRMGYCAYPIDWLTNMFIYTDREVWWNAEDGTGKIYMPYITDKYRAALQWMNKLCKEGLLSESIFSITNAEVKGMFNVATKEEQTIGIVLGHPTSIMDTTCPALQSYKCMPYWGAINTTEYGHSFRAFISGYTEVPDKAFEILMTIHSLEGAARMRLGVYGKDYKEADPGQVNSTGDPALYQRLGPDFWGTVHNKSWSSMCACSSYYNVDFVIAAGQNQAADPIVQHRGQLNTDKVIYMREAKEKYNPKLELPKIVWTTADKEAIGDIRTNCENWIKACRASFITGSGEGYTDPYDDAQWAAYIDELNKMGLADWQKIVTRIYKDQGLAVS